MKRITRRSQIGISINNAKGSKLPKTSLGIPFVVIIAACAISERYEYIHPGIFASQTHKPYFQSLDHREQLCRGRISVK